MNIKVVGAGCDKCDKLYENTMAAVKQTGIEATVEKVEDLMEIVKLGVMSSPTLLADGKQVIAGRVAKTEEIVKALQKM